jgi:hypothetical protein
VGAPDHELARARRRERRIEQHPARRRDAREHDRDEQRLPPGQHREPPRLADVRHLALRDADREPEFGLHGRVVRRERGEQHRLLDVLGSASARFLNASARLR